MTTDAGIDSRNILLTGLPRAGTTLACELLGSLPETVALDEPIDGRELSAPLTTRPSRFGRLLGRQAVPTPVDAPMAMDRIARFLAEARASILERGVAPTKVVDGQVSGRMISDEVDDAGLRIRVAEAGQIRVDKPLSPDFLLFVKHNSGFVALFPELVRRFRVHAIVRNPLSVLSSWQSVPMAIRDGHISLGERLNPPLAAQLAQINDALDRQFFLLGWFFAHFTESLPASGVTRYEDVVATGGTCLTAVTERASALGGALVSRNTSHVYDAVQVRDLGRRLLDTDGPWWRLYDRESVEAVMDGAS